MEENNKPYRVAYENIGESTYLKLTLLPEANVVGYQTEMITSNDLNYFVKVQKRDMNGEVSLYYNISSKVSLEDILGKRKLLRGEYIALITRCIHAIKEAGEYQLDARQIVLHPSGIFCNPSTSEPDFMYIPITEGWENWSLKELIVNLIMQGKIERSRDGFVQELLEVVNEEPFTQATVDAVLACLHRYSPDRTPSATKSVASFETKATSSAKPADPVPVVELRDESIEPIQSSPAKEEKPLPPFKSRAAKPQIKENTEFDAEKARKLFLIPQAVVMVVVAAVISFIGLRVDVLSALAIAVAVFEIVLYREVYVNSKKPKKEGKSGKKDKKVENAKKAEADKAPQAPRGKRPPVPSQKGKSAPVTAPERPEFPFKRAEKQEADEKLTATSSADKAAPGTAWKTTATPEGTPAAVEDAGKTGAWQQDAFDSYRNLSVTNDDADAEETVMDDPWREGEADGVVRAYLEYHEGNGVVRIPLTREVNVFGRLAKQVDYVVDSPKVGRIHAEIICNDKGIFVRDMNSRNGTYINDAVERITSNVLYELADGDRIAFADRVFVIRF